LKRNLPLIKAILEGADLPPCKDVDYAKLLIGDMTQEDKDNLIALDMFQALVVEEVIVERKKFKEGVKMTVSRDSEGLAKLASI